MSFKIGHPKYTDKGEFKIGHVPWNKNTSILIECKCLICNKIFKIRKQQFERGRGKYCSKKCFNLFLKDKIPWNKVNKTIKICLFCNKEFEVRPCEESQKFCSKKCCNNYKKGKKRPPFTEEHKEKIGKANKGNSRWGEECNHWKGGITPFYNLLRTIDEYKQWRMDCLKRDWFKCRECNSKKDLEVHHIISFQKLVNDFLQEYNQFSIIDDREILIRLTINYKPFWNINNGITLCETCHKALRRMRCQ